MMRWRLQQSRREDFVDRMVDEIYRRGVMVVRVHVAGDFVSPGYTGLCAGPHKPVNVVELIMWRWLRSPGYFSPQPLVNAT